MNIFTIIIIITDEDGSPPSRAPFEYYTFILSEGFKLSNTGIYFMYTNKQENVTNVSICYSYCV